MIVPTDPDVRPCGLKTNDDSGLVATAFSRPSLSWRLDASRSDVSQLGYELELAPKPGFDPPSVATGRVDGGSPLHVPWPRDPLASREVVWCRVRVWTDRGVTAWSNPLRIEGSLFDAGDWLARPISPAFNAGRVEPGPVPLLRRSVAVSKPLATARLYVTSLGINEFWINGQCVGNALFDPGWTDYRHRLLFAAFDVTELLKPGENVLAAAVGDGWWRGNLTWMNRRAVYGDTTALLAQLELTFADGSRETIASDESWLGGTGKLRLADIYNGCELDIGQVPAGWREPGFDDSGWAPVVALPLPAGLEQRSMPPVRVVDSFAVPALPRGDGVLAIDCGQNLTGHLRLTVHAERAGTVQARHAEVLEPDGSLHTAALREAKATDTYRVPAGNFVLEPSFTYHGFRYAEVRLDPGLRLIEAEARVVSSDLPEIGGFACSDERVNRLFENIRWSQRGNFLAIPTDCPQRDERLGWTGDIQVFAPTACANADARAFLASWLVDLAQEQAPDGNVPSTVPNVIQGHEFEFGGVGWSDAATLVPWALYQAYGDIGTLKRQFPSMRRWVDYGASRLSAEGIWTGDFHLGDWLDPGAPPEKPEQATTDRDIIASAYLAYSAGIVAQTAALLAHNDLAGQYRALAERVAAATWRRWGDEALRTQTGCAIAIEFGIVPAGELAAAGAALAGLVERAEGRIATGFLGTPLVLPALTRAGRTDAAYTLLLNEQAPGWLYQVLNGATTMWERWDAIEPDGSIHSGAMESGGGSSMISFNHYAYGSVGAWLYRTLAGLAPGEPSYALIDFAPEPGGKITWAEASIATPFGPAGIRWERSGGTLKARLLVPPGARGQFRVAPGWALADPSAELRFGSGAHELLLVSE
ncbi:MAG: family 78 glycoside hydrolase catalytic domain [Novosphingobium sp.]